MATARVGPYPWPSSLAERPPGHQNAVSIVEQIERESQVERCPSPVDFGFETLANVLASGIYQHDQFWAGYARGGQSGLLTVSTREL
jgi:hypothetical protein